MEHPKQMDLPGIEPAETSAPPPETPKEIKLHVPQNTGFVFTYEGRTIGLSIPDAFNLHTSLTQFLMHATGVDQNGRG